MEHRDEVNVYKSHYSLYYCVIAQGFKLLPILLEILICFNFGPLIIVSSPLNLIMGRKSSNMNSQQLRKIKICLAKPWECHFQRQFGLWGLRNHVQFSMKTISYFQLHFSLPAWRGWLKSSWHILFLMCSQAQMVSGKTILAKLSVRIFVILLFFFYFSTMSLHHCACSSVFAVPPSSHVPPSCSHIELSGTRAPLKWCERFGGAC